MTNPARGTRERILETAERLFAQRGIDQTSVRQINLAAGQRNASATAYHFGSRDALLGAVLEYRREAINARRLALLHSLEQDGRHQDLRALVGALVHPLAERLGRKAEGDHYIRVIAQVTGHPRYHRMAQARSRHGSGLERLLELLRACLPALPEEILRQRFGMALRQVFNELADYQRLYLARSRTAAAANIPLFVSNLVDVVTGMLAAPVSTATIGEITQGSHKAA
jgi:AcrR family transcriptional regulator